MPHPLAQDGSFQVAPQTALVALGSTGFHFRAFALGLTGRANIECVGMETHVQSGQRGIPSMVEPVVARVIQAHPFTRGLHADDQEIFVQCAKRLQLPPGDYILRRGEAADAFFLLWAGEVDLGIASPAEGFLRLDTIGPWEILGWSWIVEPFRWNFDALAMTQIDAVALDARSLLAEMQTNPRLRLEVLERLLPVTAERVRSSREKLFSLETRLRRHDDLVSSRGPLAAAARRRKSRDGKPA